MTAADAAAHVAALKACTSRAEATAYAADHLRGRTLTEVIAQTGAVTWGPVADRQRQVVEFLVGRRLDSEAIGRVR